MKVAIVKASQLFEHGRWDAGFHIALSELGQRVEALKACVTADEAIEQVMALPREHLQHLQVLGTGSNPLRSLSDFRAVTERYPHFALALTEREGPKIAAALQAQVDKYEAARQRFNELLERASPAPEPDDGVPGMGGPR